MEDESGLWERAFDSMASGFYPVLAQNESGPRGIPEAALSVYPMNAMQVKICAGRLLLSTVVPSPAPRDPQEAEEAEEDHPKIAD